MPVRSLSILFLSLAILAGGVVPAAASLTCLTGSGKKAVRACTTVIEDKASTLEMRIMARRFRAAANLELGNYRPVIADLDEIIGSGKALAKDWWQRGTAEYYYGDYAKAVSDLDKANNLSADEVVYAADLAYAQISDGRVDEAISRISRIISRHPDNPDLLASRGWAYYMAGSLHAALADYDKTIKIQPSNALWRNQRGLVRESLKDWRGAETDYSAAIKQRPRDAAFLKNRGLLRNIQGFPGALADITEALAIEKSAELHVERAQILVQDGKPELAEDDLKQADRLAGDAARITVLRGQILSAKSDYTSAIALYENVLARDPDHVDARYQRALANFGLGRYRDAYEELTQLVRKLPQDEGLRNRRAVVSIQMEHFQEAIDDLSQAILLDPTFINPYLNRARAYNLTKQWELAIEDCNRAIQLGSPSDAATAYYRRGFARRGRSDLVRAAEDYAHAVERDPAFADAHAERAIVLLDLDRFDEARTAIGKAIALDPNWSSYRVRLGWIEEKAGDNKAALASYQKAIDLDPADPWGFEGRAWIEFFTGNLVGALSDCETTIDLMPQEPAAYRCRANVRMEQSDLPGAVSDLTRAVVMNDSYGPGFFDRAMVNEESANYADAIKDYSRAITLKYRVVESLVRRGDVKRALNDRKAAIRDYQQALDLDKGKFAQAIAARLARQNNELPMSERDELNYPQPLRNKSRSAK